MTQKLQNKIALITGGTSGMGLATARLFAAQGAHVIVTGRSPESLAQAEKELGGTAQVVRADTASLSDIDRLLAGIRDRHGRLDVLFANAGVGNFRPVELADEEHFDSQFDINVKGAFFTVQKALPLLGQGASIIFNTSGLANRGFAQTAVYTATKSALSGLTRALAAELAPRGIRVNAIAPGPIETPIYQRLGLPQEAVPGFLEGIKQGVPLKRLGQSDEIARAALFLASDDSSFITGEELSVDGGMVKVSA
jgi:NAD(P)-dependent dehydrogenase (short-subunit alcohol dehydrogenase family)